jgi:MFS transporter, MHS family, shikimate and dehydroshikimate transport protein
VNDSGRANTEQTSSMRKVAVASLVGTSIEWYDFFIYAAASALVFGSVFFPTFSETAGTLAAFATFGVSFVARPVGGVIFGHFGDRVGRKSMLIITLLMMGVSTFLIGCLPTFDAIGILAPILLVVLRIVQGLSVGGEWGGAILMSAEHASEDRRNFYGSFPQLGSPVGSISSAGIFALVGLLPDEQFFAWGWRIPFLLSAILIVVGLYVRLKIAESPAFEQVKESQSEARVPFLDMLRGYPVEALLRVGTVFYAIGGFYITNTYALSYATSDVGAARSVVLSAIVISAIVQIVGNLGGAALADRIGRRPVILASTAAVVLLPFPFFGLISTGVTASIWLAYVLVGFFGGASYALIGVLLSPLFDSRVRYSGISFGYQWGGMISAAVAPAAATALVARAGGNYWPAAALLTAYALISLISMAFASREKYQKEIYQRGPAESTA